MQFEWNKVLPGPQNHEIEVCVFGPGYGESILVHLGDQRWIVVDSCVESQTGQPAALSYLRTIGVDPARSVEFIFATHWHDDHIRGLASTLAICTQAHVCFSTAFAKLEFIAFLSRFESRCTIEGGSGVRELWNTVKEIERRGATGKFVGPDRRILTIPQGVLSHGFPCEVWTLSPSDTENARFLDRIAALEPRVGETKRRAPSVSRNDVAAVVMVDWERTALLLCSDLEVTTDSESGWAAILASTGKPGRKASFFKIPHHGSANGHHDGVWSNMLEKDPIAVLTPWNRGNGLPQKSDVDRIVSITSKGYSTSDFLGRKPQRRSSEVERTLKEARITVVPRELQMGMVRARFLQENWVVETFNRAGPLNAHGPRAAAV